MTQTMLPGKLPAPRASTENECSRPGHQLLELVFVDRKRLVSLPCSCGWSSMPRPPAQGTGPHKTEWHQHHG